jgi:hypothetical protein
MDGTEQAVVLKTLDQTQHLAITPDMTLGAFRREISRISAITTEQQRLIVGGKVVPVEREDTPLSLVDIHDGTVVLVIVSPQIPVCVEEPIRPGPNAAEIIRAAEKIGKKLDWEADQDGSAAAEASQNVMLRQESLKSLMAIRIELRAIRETLQEQSAELEASNRHVGVGSTAEDAVGNEADDEKDNEDEDEDEEVTSEVVQNLMDMGFTRHKVQLALRKTSNNVSAALDILLDEDGLEDAGSNLPEAEAEKIEEEEAAPPEAIPAPGGQWQNYLRERPILQRLWSDDLIRNTLENADCFQLLQHLAENPEDISHELDNPEISHFLLHLQDAVTNALQ